VIVPAVGCVAGSQISLQYAKLRSGSGRRRVSRLTEWEIYVTDEVRDWITALDDASHRLVVQASISSPTGARHWAVRWLIMSSIPRSRT